MHVKLEEKIFKLFQQITINDINVKIQYVVNVCVRLAKKELYKIFDK